MIDRMNNKAESTRARMSAIQGRMDKLLNK